MWRLDAERALVATTDFFTPIVDDPGDFGRIAAANALSDLYAMGARPILALAIVGMPLDKLPLEVISRILAGGGSVCAQAGIPIAGGHSIDVPEPIYGLVALGLVHPAHVKRNRSARAGDLLVLGKPLGVGILSAALKKDGLSESGYARMIEHTTRLNTPGMRLAALEDVHAMTDVTGFGLAGHLLEICRGSGLAAKLAWGGLPFIAEAVELARRGVATGASARNWSSYGTQVELPEGFEDWKRALLTDPQTSGGLLVACAAGSAGRVIELFREEGFADAAVIGGIEAGAPRIRVLSAAGAAA
ncbi:MAG: selenide, water dikinase SelD [Rhodocyclaceae bacterium]